MAQEIVVTDPASVAGLAPGMFVVRADAETCIRIDVQSGFLEHWLSDWKPARDSLVPEEWPEEVSEDLSEIAGEAEDFLETQLAPRTVFLMPAILNDAAVAMVSIEGVSHLVAFDPYEAEFVARRTLAESYWSSESGGAPVSWDGRDKLLELGGGLVVSQSVGDIERDTDIRVLPTDQDFIANAIAEWVDSVEAARPAALVEPLNAISLDGETGQRWIDVIATVGEQCGLSLHEDVESAVRTRLRETSSAYKSVANALAAPDSDEGRQLLETLEGVAEGGVLGDFLYG